MLKKKKVLSKLLIKKSQYKVHIVLNRVIVSLPKVLFLCIEPFCACPWSRIKVTQRIVILKLFTLMDTLTAIMFYFMYILLDVAT